MKRPRRTIAVYGAAFAAAAGLHIALALVLGGVLGSGRDRAAPAEIMTLRQEPLAVSFRRPEPVQLQPKAAPPVTRLRQPEPQPARDPPPELPDPRPEAAASEIPPPAVQSAAGELPEGASDPAPATASPDPAASRFADARPARSRGAAAPVVRAVKPRPLTPIDAEAIYPLGSRLRGEEGTVRLSVSVDPQGRVELLKVVGSSGFTALDRAAEKAVRQTRFAPGARNDRPVSDELVIAIRFRLDS